MEQQYPVFIEIPLGTKNNKYERDPQTGKVVLDFVFEDLVWPYNYGEISGTLGGDGDCLDALVFSSKPLKQEATIFCVPFGVMRSLDRGEVDDKFLMVPAGDEVSGPYRDIYDFSENERQRLREFYAEIARQKKKIVKILDFKDKKIAGELIERAVLPATAA